VRFGRTCGRDVRDAPATGGRSPAAGEPAARPQSSFREGITRNRRDTAAVRADTTTPAIVAACRDPGDPHSGHGSPTHMTDDRCGRGGGRRPERLCATPARGLHLWSQDATTTGLLGSIGSEPEPRRRAIGTWAYWAGPRVRAAGAPGYGCGDPGVSSARLRPLEVFATQ